MMCLKAIQLVEANGFSYIGNVTSPKNLYRKGIKNHARQGAKFL